MSAESITWEEPNAVQIHVRLDGVEPPVWRRLLVPLGVTLAGLHHILQAAMGWTDSHLHRFNIGGLTYGDVDLLSEDSVDGDPRVYDASEVLLRDFDRDPGTSFVYIYDFGDDWRHAVTLEKLVAAKPAMKTATCLDGARCCPPEDVGGSRGYAEFLRILQNPAPHELEDQRHFKRWSGGRFDPERFDVEKTAKAVRNALRRKAE